MILIKSIRFIVLLLLVSSQAFSQQVDDVPYTTETAGGINFNTNGGIIGGAMFKRSIHFKKNQYHVFALEFVNVKHPKEQRKSSPITGNTFLYFKQNYFFVLRPQYGREFLLFNKSEEEGVRVNGLIAAGPSLGILKPYAIDYDYTDYSKGQGPPTDIKSEPFDPEIHTDPDSRILGTGGLFTGIGGSKIIPGLSLKAGLNFEFGNSTTGVEVGGLMEIFPKKILIIPRAENSNFFTSIYINIYFSSRN